MEGMFNITASPGGGRQDEIRKFCPVNMKTEQEIQIT